MTNNFTVLGFDPGGSTRTNDPMQGYTGICALHFNGSSKTPTVLFADEVGYTERYRLWFEVLPKFLVQSENLDALPYFVIEDFFLYGDKAVSMTNDKFYPVKVIQLIESGILLNLKEDAKVTSFNTDILQLYRSKRIRLRSASTISKVKVLEEHKQYLKKPGTNRKSEHMHDAYKHARLTGLNIIMRENN